MVAATFVQEAREHSRTNISYSRFLPVKREFFLSTVAIVMSLGASGLVF